jgi:hypothetical protein
MSQPESVLKKAEPEPKQEKEQPEPEPFVIKVSAVKPESAIINGGLWVLTIPLNRIPRFMIVGFAYDAFHRLLKLLDEMDEAREKRKASLTQGLKDFAVKATAGAVGLIKGGNA